MSEVIDKLTPEQEAQIEVYLNKWLSLGYKTEAMDVEKAKAAVDFIYTKLLNLPTPPIHIVQSPLEGQILCNKLARNVDARNLQPGETLEYYEMARSNWWMSSYAFYDYVLHVLFPEKSDEFPLFNEFLEHSHHLHFLWTFDEAAIICDFPSVINVEPVEGKLTATQTSSVVYRDGYEIFCYEGESMPKEEWMKVCAKFHSPLGQTIFQKI